ncbi:hypothetical protein TNCV_3078991 [Trichonephila clavipes]|nr:hypothetical protein TNCV_3078991 [Trichonephila clavipes]
MAPHVKGAPAALVTNQANQSNLPTTPPTVNINNNGTFDMNFITQTLQKTILALSMLTQHIGNATSLPHLNNLRNQKIKNNAKKNYTPYSKHS